MKCDIEALLSNENNLIDEHKQLLSDERFVEIIKHYSRIDVDIMPPTYQVSRE